MQRCVAVGVLASGGGTNLQAVIDAAEAGRIAARVAVVISDREGAACLERARRHGIAAVHVPVPKTGTPEWEAANDEIIEAFTSRGVELVAMAGYMRKVTPRFLQTFGQAVMNIHPALLPSFAGQHGQRDANDYAVKLAGATVHLADEEFDGGPIIIQGAVPVLDDDTEETLAARILKVEHVIYPQAIQWFAEGRLSVVGRRVLLDGAPTVGPAALIWPPPDEPAR